MKHGHNRRGLRSSTYRSWRAMIQRCTHSRSQQWKWYGARGVKVCIRWMRFEAFLEDMGPRPAGATLDRYPNRSGDYEPGNVRWASHLEQMRNCSHTKLTIQIADQIRSADASGSYSRSEIARVFGCHPSTVSKILVGGYWR